jgi:hypothetical protein
LGLAFTSILNVDTPEIDVKIQAQKEPVDREAQKPILFVNVERSG